MFSPAEEGRSSLSAKQRALQSLLEMKRSGELQFLAEEMESAQRKFEAKAAQFREISARMRRGVVNAMRSGELERLVGEMTEVLETQAMGKALVLSCLPMSRKAESIRTRVRKGGPEQPQSCGCRIRGSFDGRTAAGASPRRAGGSAPGPSS